MFRNEHSHVGKKGKKENGNQFIKMSWVEWEDEGVYWKLIGKGKRKETELNWKTL